MARDSSDLLANIAVERPRLMATKAAIARAQTLLGHNRTAQKWQQQIATQANVILDQPTLTQAWVHYPRETAAAPLTLVPPPKSTHGPAARLDIARLFCLRIQILGITWFLTGHPRYRDRAKAELLAVCAFPGWADDKFLTTAETAFGAAIGYDWVYDVLTDAERKQIAQAIVDKAIEPGLDQFAKPSHPFWTKTAMNWNLVCNGGLMIAALWYWSLIRGQRSSFRCAAILYPPVSANLAPMAGGWRARVIGTTLPNTRSTSSTVCRQRLARI